MLRSYYSDQYRGAPVSRRAKFYWVDTVTGSWPVAFDCSTIPSSDPKAIENGKRKKSNKRKQHARRRKRQGRSRTSQAIGEPPQWKRRTQKN